MPGQPRRRYGPGGFPYADSPDVAAGVAMATTGLLGAVLWFVGAGLLYVLGIGGTTPGFFLVGGVLVAPVAIPAAFALGTLLWRLFPPLEDDPYAGSLLGALTALGSMVVGAFGPSFMMVAGSLSGGRAGLGSALGLWLLSFLFTIVAVGWLVVPLGAVGGVYHERAVESMTDEESGPDRAG